VQVDQSGFIWSTAAADHEPSIFAIGDVVGSRCWRTRPSHEGASPSSDGRGERRFARRHLDHRDVAAEGGVHRTELQPDVSRADHEQRCGNVGQIERAVESITRGSSTLASAESPASIGREDGVLELDAFLAGPGQRQRRLCASTISA